MGKLDIKSKIYFQNKERFADLFNFKLYGGRQQHLTATTGHMTKTKTNSRITSN